MTSSGFCGRGTTGGGGDMTHMYKTVLNWQRGMPRRLGDGVINWCPLTDVNIQQECLFLLPVGLITTCPCPALTSGRTVKEAALPRSTGNARNYNDRFRFTSTNSTVKLAAYHLPPPEPVVPDEFNWSSGSSEVVEVRGLVLPVINDWVPGVTPPLGPDAGPPTSRLWPSA
ncbi:hypothetical protein J6590_027926 [Homalodisca vitripennis]|nr:hypothetical protein J6590_027926 [Homalodisca vitripennis]